MTRNNIILKGVFLRVFYGLLAVPIFTVMSLLDPTFVEGFPFVALVYLAVCVAGGISDGVRKPKSRPTVRALTEKDQEFIEQSRRLADQRYILIVTVLLCSWFAIWLTRLPWIAIWDRGDLFLFTTITALWIFSLWQYVTNKKWLKIIDKLSNA